MERRTRHAPFSDAPLTLEAVRRAVEKQRARAATSARAAGTVGAPRPAATRSSG
jgi:hypothetical protein